MPSLCVGIRQLNPPSLPKRCGAPIASTPTQSHGISQLFPASPPTLPVALGARNACLVGENLKCSGPALWGCESLWSYDYGHAQHEYTPPVRPPKSNTGKPLANVVVI